MEKFNAETGHAILKAAELDNSLQQLLLHAMPKMFEAICASLRHCEPFSPTPRCQCDLPVRRSSIKRGSSRRSTQREQMLECHSIPPFREQRWRLTTRSTGCSTGTRLRSDPLARYRQRGTSHVTYVRLRCLAAQRNGSESTRSSRL
jgi:hypothetical protein